MATNPLSQLITVHEREWQEMQPGVRMKHLWADEATKRRALISKIEPGAQLPLHRHVGDEFVYVIEGTLSDESGTVTPGNMGYRPDGCAHTVSTKTGATVLAVITGGIEPAKEISGAPRSQIFTLSEISWVDARPGIRMKTIWHDQTSERRVALGRFEPGAILPLHRHVGDELVFVIEGANADEAGEVATGNLSYRPNGCTHTVTSKNGATALTFLWGRSEMV